MLTPRTAITVALLLFLTFAVISIWSAMQPSDSGGRGFDSFGTRIEGHRGLFETFERLGFSIERRFTPPDATLPLDSSLVLIAPNPMTLGFEPLPLQQLRPWISSGGRLVVFAPDLVDLHSSQIEQMQNQLDHFDPDVFSLLQIDGVSVESLSYREVPVKNVPDQAELSAISIRRHLSSPEQTAASSRESTANTVAGSGMSEGVDEGWSLAFPMGDLAVLHLKEDGPARPHTSGIDGLEEMRTIAATIPIGKGEIVIVSDPHFVTNLPWGAEENAAWGVHLLTDGGTRQVVIDEFYHGLMVRGNNWWLLTKPAYLLPFLAILLLLGLITWRFGTMLGPALATQEPSRRVVSEYVEAMGDFFLKASDGRRFVLKSVHQGIWRRLCKELHLPPSTKDLETIVSLMSRRDPERANRIQQAFQESEQMFESATLRPVDCMKTLSQLDRCLHRDEEARHLTANAIR
ncbi:MAG: DUF4350 domain-containing protein [Planctomycetaceae bacterium]